MLTNDALESAIPLTQNFDARSLLLTAIPGTPLAELVKATRSDNNFVNTNNGVDFDPSVYDISYIANVTPVEGGTSLHDVVMDEVALMAIKTVSRNLLFARSVASPAICDLAERVQNSLHELLPSKLTKMEVISFVTPAPLDMPQFASEIRKFNDTPSDNPPLSMRLPTIPASEIIENLKTGAKSIDSAIGDWVATKGESFFTDIWANIFQISDDRRTFNDWTRNNDEGLETALAIYLLARRLETNPPEGTDMPLPKYKTLMASYLIQAGGRLYRGLQTYDRDEKNDILIRFVTKDKTVVNDGPYRRWLENGGNIDILYGNMMSQTPVITGAALLDKREELEKTWQRQAMLLTQVENNNRLNRVKELFGLHFRSQLTTCEDVNANMIDLVVKRFNDEVETIRLDDLKELHMTTLKLVCRSRFAHTECERILMGIEHARQNFPDAPIEECAAVAAIDYVAHWVATQMKCSAL